jgi:hypothetical protein
MLGVAGVVLRLAERDEQPGASGRVNAIAWVSNAAASASARAAAARAAAAST